MKKNYFVFLFCFFICALPFQLNAQKGSIKLFSEIKGVQVFLDEELKGTDLTTIDSIAPGSHYLKVTKDEVILFGELVNVKANENNTILVKDSKEIQEKLLARKYKEQEIYRSKRLDVLQDTKLITETSGNTEISEKTKSMYFPGYYSVLGGSSTSGNVATKSTTVTKSETSWFIIRGNQKISHKEFAELTNNADYFTRFKEYNEKLAKYEQIKTQKPKWKIDTTPLIIGAVFVGGGLLLYDSKVNIFAGEGSGLQIAGNILGGSSAFVGSIAFLIGLFSHEKPYNPMPSFYSPITMDAAIRDSKEYNRKLKIELGLPENFEPQK